MGERCPLSQGLNTVHGDLAKETSLLRSQGQGSLQQEAGPRGGLGQV